MVVRAMPGVVTSPAASGGPTDAPGRPVRLEKLECDGDVRLSACSVVDIGSVVIRRAVNSDAAAVADVWVRSFAAALPEVRRAHTDQQVRAWFRDVVPAGGTWVAAVDDVVVGMMVLDGPELEQLYVDPPWWGRGIGGRLMELAKKHHPTGLSLRTFQVNDRARRFYERHGFVATESTDGHRNEEHEPDVRYIWRPEN